MNDNFLNNIIIKLKSIYFHIDQKIVYLIFQKLFNYTKVIKLKQYDKTIINIFTDIQMLIKCLKIALTLDKDIYDRIAIIIAFDFIYNNFNTKISSFLKISNKRINKMK